jgi:hypothetical protein
MAHVLGMAALELGHPLTFDVLVKADDPPLHAHPAFRARTRARSFARVARR